MNVLQSHILGRIVGAIALSKDKDKRFCENDGSKKKITKDERSFGEVLSEVINNRK